MSDFNLHPPKGANTRKFIIGRGQSSGKGTTAGRGTKGQKARSGGKTYPGFEGGQMPLYRRLAQRGFSNYPFKKNVQIVNLGEIDKKYNDGENVDIDSLLERGLISRTTLPTKILGEGNFSKKLIFKFSVFSQSAKEKIEKAGSSIVES
ncbi:MAG: 50S ribosomal protein L15 [Treponema sp.]|nr:50S ribosomal protein L15 [Treponema sp.]